MRILITGGAGFIGAHTALHFLEKGHRVTILDNLSRRGTEENLFWLFSQSFAGHKLTFRRADVRDSEQVLEAMEGIDVVIHLAAQVAVTTSIQYPVEDFTVNALGSLTVLEAARRQPHPPMILYSSTNKVYGSMTDLPYALTETRWTLPNQPQGISESQPLDFHSPYGCSKGSADQYIRDYSRIFGLDTVVFRQSCIYGEHQNGTEDQGWLAYFIRALLAGEPLTIYGDGKQVRDLLHVRDLVRAYDLAIQRREQVRGEVFNIGGGADQAVSIWEEASTLLEQPLGKSRIDQARQKITYDPARPGDQLVFISDNAKVRRMLGWKPMVDPKTGIDLLVNWLKKG